MRLCPCHTCTISRLVRSHQNNTSKCYRGGEPCTRRHITALLAVTNHRLRRVGRLVILLLRAVVAIPRWLIGIPRTEWHTLHELTPTTSTDDLLSRLYRNVQYRFYPFGGLGNAMSIYHNPFRLLNLRGPDARNHYQFTLNQTNRYGTSASRRFPTDRYERIRFHESRHA